MHTARIWMALAIPGGAPGYDYNNKLGNFITHIAARTSQRLRGYSHQALEVKGDGFSGDFARVTRFRAFGEGEFWVCRHAGGAQTLVMPGLVPGIHVLCA